MDEYLNARYLNRNGNVSCVSLHRRKEMCPPKTCDPSKWGRRGVGAVPRVLGGRPVASLSGYLLDFLEERDVVAPFLFRCCDGCAQGPDGCVRCDQDDDANVKQPHVKSSDFDMLMDGHVSCKCRDCRSKRDPK